MKHIPDLETNMMKLTFGYNSTLVVPWKEGMVIVQALEKARFVTSNYVDNQYVWKYHDNLAITFETFSPLLQAQLLLPEPEVTHE